MAFATKKVYVDPAVYPKTKLPAGHGVAIAESSLGTPDITEDYVFTLAASDSVDSTDIIGFDDLLNTELVADLDAFIAAATGLGVKTGTHTVSYNARVIDIQLGAGADLYLNSANINFLVTLQLRVYVSA